MTDIINPKIFLSYAWANTDIANEIDGYCSSIGISFIRDTRDLTYRNSIKEFMQRIGESDFVVMLISDEYLRSENCMYEVTELFGTREFKMRILPIVLDNARHIFTPFERSTYYEYWSKKLKDAEKFKKKYGTQDSIDLMKKCVNINNCIDVFFTDLSDLNTSNFFALKENNYRELLEIIGFDDRSLIDELTEITQMEDFEDQAIVLEDFLRRNPNNFHGLSYNAHLANQRGEFKKAKKYYEALLEKYPMDAGINYNFAVLLKEQFLDLNGARKHYEKTLMADDRHAPAHNNMGTLLANYFLNYDGARKHYEMAIEVNPRYEKVHYNLGNLLKNYFFDYKAAKKCYEDCIELDPWFAPAFNNLANLLKEHFMDYENARKYYEKALKVDYQYSITHYNYANLLKDYVGDYKKAKKHYKIALKIDPNYIKAHYNYADLLSNHLNDKPAAIKHLIIVENLESQSDFI